MNENIISVIQVQELINIVESLMIEFEIPIRDTWNGYDGYNYDDFYSNGNVYNGKRFLKVMYKENGTADVAGKKVYTIPGFKSAAYDSFEIRIPNRLCHLKHVVIHELVHFLQTNTVDEEKQYINFNGNNYLNYIAQRTELEAHFIQLIYIYRFELDLVVTDLKVREDLEEQFSTLDKLKLILYSKSKNII